MSSLSGATLCPIEKLENHPNADRLDLVHVQGCPAIVGRDEYSLGENVVFVPFDVIIPDSEAFPDYVRGKRVRAVKLRGIFSMGVILKNTWGFVEGDNIDEALGLTKWEPKVSCGSGHSDGQEILWSHIVCPKYDLESLRKYHSLLEIGEEVVINEKVHGASSRFCFWDEQFYAGSRNRWLKESDNIWWRVARDLYLADKLAELPEGYVLYGEVYGAVQDLRYGMKNDEVKFVAFDIYDAYNHVFLDTDDFLRWCDSLNIPNTPLIYRGSWQGLDSHKELAEGKSLIADHVREGFVIKPVMERRDHRVGRVALKLHGEGYLTRKTK